MNQTKEFIKLLKILSETKQLEIFYMIKGASIVARKEK